MKTGIVVVVHGQYGQPLLEVADEIVGPMGLVLIAFTPGMDLSLFKGMISNAFTTQDQGQGVLLLTDICGSTPANICLKIVESHHGSEIITGINLAMLLKLSTCDRHLSPSALADELRKTSQKSIQLGSEIIHRGGSCHD
jgi:mannose PTS system EIIA component